MATGFKRRNFHPQLHEQMAMCDGNYIRLLKLLPPVLPSDRNYRTRFDQRQIVIPGIASESGMQVIFTVLEHFRYTTEIDIVQLRPHAEGHYQSPRMQVRMYHDAQTAEVISYQHKRYLWQAPKDTSGATWHALTSEKIQLNRFLGEWLAICLDKGLAPPEQVFINTVPDSGQ